MQRKRPPRGNRPTDKQASQRPHAPKAAPARRGADARRGPTKRPSPTTAPPDRKPARPDRKPARPDRAARPEEPERPRTVPRLPTPELSRGLRPLPPPGSWILACREGFEIDIAEEVQLARLKRTPRLLVPGLLSLDGAPPRREGRIELTFARQAFPLAMALVGDDRLAERIADALIEASPERGPITFQWFVPDSDSGNRLSQAAARLGEEVTRALGRRLGERLVEGDPRRAGGFLAQLCLVEEHTAFVGGLPVTTAPSAYPGGRARMTVSPKAPSRAAMKITEALDWLGLGPDPGDLCVDLGAAPGGWTYVLVERRAKVVAVDPGRLVPQLARHKSVATVHRSAFEFEPDEPVDWLFCDMAWRPLEVAALLARWGRRRLARTMVANIKLPMKRKAEFVARVREIVETGGWSDVRTRHLYHDREEITLTAWRR